MAIYTPKYTDHFSRRVAEMLVPKGAVIISITDPHSEPSTLSDGWPAILRLQFHDITSQLFQEGDEVYELPNADHAWQIGDFIRAHNDKSIYVHCEAGVSRSAAVCDVLQEMGWEYRGFQRLKLANPLLRGLLREQMGLTKTY